MAILRLYQIIDSQTRKNACPDFFADKKLAKERRRSMNGPPPETLRYVVSPGPDHHNYDPNTR